MCILSVLALVNHPTSSWAPAGWPGQRSTTTVAGSHFC